MSDQMKELDLEITQVILNNFNLKEVVQANFIELLQKELENVKIIGLSIAIGDEDDERIITLGHLTQKAVKEKKLIIDTRSPEDLNVMLNAIKEYKKRD